MNFARFSTDWKCWRVSAELASSFTWYFFWMATPSSRASMESSPRPAPNNGALGSMSEGCTSSRSSESMMSCFSSSISAFMVGQLLLEEIFHGVGHAPRRHAVGHTLAIAEGAHVLRRIEADQELPGALRRLPPGAALGERGWGAGDHHRQHLATGAQRHLRRAAAELGRLAGGGAGALREQHQGAAALQGLHAGVQRLRRIAVADVAGGAHEAAV